MGSQTHSDVGGGGGAALRGRSTSVISKARETAVSRLLCRLELSPL